MDKKQFGLMAEQLSFLMAASNSGEAHAVMRDTNGDISGCVVIAIGVKAGDVMACIGDLENVWGEKPAPESDESEDDCDCNTGFDLCACLGRINLECTCGNCHCRCTCGP